MRKSQNKQTIARHCEEGHEHSIVGLWDKNLNFFDFCSLLVGFDIDFTAYRAMIQGTRGLEQKCLCLFYNEFPTDDIFKVKKKQADTSLTITHSIFCVENRCHAFITKVIRSLYT